MGTVRGAQAYAVCKKNHKEQCRVEPVVDKQFWEESPESAGETKKGTLATDSRPAGRRTVGKVLIGREGSEGLSLTGGELGG